MSPRARLRLLGRRALAAGLGVTVVASSACAGGQAVPTPQVSVLDAAGALELARRHARERKPAEVLAVAARARTLAALGPELRGLEIRALWQLNRPAEAQQAQAALAATTGPEAERARQVAADLVHWHLTERKQPEAAWQALQPWLAEGCRGAASCALAARLLTAMAAHPEHARRALQAAPRPTLARVRWLQALADKLAAQGHGPAALMVLDAARQDLPHEPALWLGTYALLRRQQGVDGRAQWLAQLRVAGLPADVLDELAAAPELATDRPLVLQLLGLAVARPDATERHVVRLAQVLARGPDRAGLAELARRPEKLTTRLGRLALARHLQVAGLPDLAEPHLQAARAQGPDDGLLAALEADLLLRRGQSPAAVARAREVVKTAADPSLVAWLLGVLWRRQLPGEAEPWLHLAAATPGAGQLPAARALAVRHLQQPGSNQAAAQLVLRYARLLAQAPVPPAAADALAMLGDEPEPPPARARETLVRLLETRRPWDDTLLATLRAFADAGVAEPEMLRMLAMRTLGEQDVEGFLALDRRARAAASTAGIDLANDKVVKELVQRSETALARWLRDADLHEVEDAALSWKIAGKLLSTAHGLLGRRWARQSLQRHGRADVPPDVLNAMASQGAADVALEVLEERRQAGEASDPMQMRVETAAWLALGRADRAAAVLERFAARPESSPKLIGGVVGLAYELGLCPVAVSLAPRMVHDADLYTLRQALGHGLGCARALQREDAAQAIVAAVRRPPTDPTRLDLLARELATQGFEQLAIGVFEELDRQRPLSDDSLKQWGRALLGLGRTAEAAQMLQRMAALVRGRSARKYLEAADLLEDHGQLAAAHGFLLQAATMEPDNTRLRVRLASNAMRQGKPEIVDEQLQGLVRMSPAADELAQLRQVAERTGYLRALYDVLATVTEPDREAERFRLELAAALGDREAVVAGVRRLRARGTEQSAQVPAWLVETGALRAAREVAEDMLASPESAGAATDRLATLILALEHRRDPTSAEQALSLVRLYTGRALEAGDAAVQAAKALADLGMMREAAALAALADGTDSADRLAWQAVLAWRAGDRKTAANRWERAMAAVLLTPRLTDLLRRADLQTKVAIMQPIGRLAGLLPEAGELPRLQAWLAELVQVAPESEQLQGLRISAALQAGDVAGAAGMLRDAVRLLPSPENGLFERLAERIAREGGRDALVAWLVAEGGALRTVPWLAAMAQGLAVDALAQPPGATGAVDGESRAVLAGLARDLETLTAHVPELRAAAAQHWGSRGDGARALAALGPSPLLPAERRYPGAPVQAVAAALVAAGPQAGQAVVPVRGETVPAPPAWTALQGWLRDSRGWEMASALAAELVRQGRPDLARQLLQLAPGTVHLGPAAADALARRLVASVAGEDDERTLAAALAFLRGRRGLGLDHVRERGQLPSVEVRLASEMVFDALLTTGRSAVARKLQAALQAEEPGLRPPPELDDAAEAGNTLAFARLVEQFHPAALAVPVLPVVPQAVGQAAQALAAAADPERAVAWTAQLAQRHDEAWRPWWHLVRQAVHFDQPDLARAALRKATELGAPAGVTACAAPGLEGKGTLAGCVRGRPLVVLALDELGDLAAGVAAGAETGGIDLVAALAMAEVATLERFTAVAAARAAGLPPEQRQRLTGLLSRVHAALTPEPRQAAWALASLDALAALQLAEPGLRASEAAWREDPAGRGQRNNLAYARFLAGHDPHQVLAFALPAAAQAGGEPAHATLDTLGALYHAAGQTQQALAVQRASLASALALPESERPRLGLPMARLAELVLAAGAADEARILAVRAVDAAGAGMRELDEDEDAFTLGRARRVLKASLQALRQRARATP